MLSHEREAHVVEVVQRELPTPLGLRTLSPANPAYRPRCEGGVAERDSAYHQGTVWPWLMGPFLRAYLKVHRGSEPAMAQGERMAAALCSTPDVRRARANLGDRRR